MGALDRPSRLVENLRFVALQTAASRFMCASLFIRFGRPSLGFVYCIKAVRAQKLQVWYVFAVQKYAS